MAFSDDDIAAHMRDLRAPNGRRVNLADSSVYNYVSIDGPLEAGSTPKSSQGRETWRQRLQRENEERFTLKGINKLHWRKTCA